MGYSKPLPYDLEDFTWSISRLWYVLYLLTLCSQTTHSTMHTCSEHSTNISLHQRIGLQVLYVIMMYISVYPVVITMRHSNVYEERSLGIYADDDDSDPSSQPPKLDSSLFSTIRRTFTSAAAPFSTPAMQSQQRSQFVRQQIRGQLSHDMWWLVLAILLISCIEVSNFDRDPVTYSVFNITFEVVSGYGCVGISTGLPNEAYSEFSPILLPFLLHPSSSPFPSHIL
jgi:Trk-type K+ transport system membrane component